MYGLVKQIAEHNNINLVRNASYLLAKNNKRGEDKPVVDPTKQRFDLTMFKLTY